MHHFDRLLVPVDFSASSEAACNLAVVFAARLSASIELLHAWDVPAWSGAVLPDLVVNMPGEGEQSLDQFVQSRAGTALQRLVVDLERRGVSSVRSRLEMGDPSSVIVRVAQEGKFGLIVMGTHGRRGFSRILMGSVAEKVVRFAPCPVLTVRVPDEQAELAVEPLSAIPSPPAACETPVR